jgi:hypothetical protein
MLLVGLLLLTPAVAAQAQGGGVIEGRVVNGTADADPVGAGLPVTLVVYEANQEVATFETATDAEGGYRFEDLDANTELEYWLEVEYLDVLYSSQAPYQFDAGQPVLETTLMVYETTDDDSAIRVDSVHVIAESFEQVLRISEIHLFGNTGDRTYVGSDGQTVFVPLPEGAVGISLQEGMSENLFVEAEGGLQSMDPVWPGSETSLAFFSYHIMVAGDEVPVERTFAYPVSSLSVLVAQPGLSMTSEQLVDQGPELFQDRQYQFYTALDVAADTPILLEFVPQPGAATGSGMTGDTAAGGTAAGTEAAASTRGNQGLLWSLGLVVTLAAVVGSVTYAVTAKPGAVPAAGKAKLKQDPKARKLVAELASLEDAFEAGEIDRESYKRKRNEMYEALKSL